jgi:hypothetical protein
VSVVLVLLSVAALLTCLAILVAHLNDLWALDHTSGVWFALAWFTNHGRFYPPVAEGGLYGGTRYMPVYFLAHAGLALGTGEYLVAGKVLSLLVAVAWWGLLWAVLRRTGCPRAGALGLVAAAAASSIGLAAAGTVRGDLLPVVWQLAALLVVAGGTQPWRPLLAGFLCTLAVLTKITAGWGALAILAWYFSRDRRALGVFLLAWLGSLAAALGVLHLVTSGRMLSSFQAVRDPSSLTVGTFLNSPFRLVRFAATGCGVLQLFIPFAVVECVAAAYGRRWLVWHWAGLFCLPVLLVIYADHGVAYNHLIDLLTLTIVLVGLLWASPSTGAEPAVGLKTVLLVAVFWGLASQFGHTLGHQVRTLGTTAQTLRHIPFEPLAGQVGPGPLLSENPLVPVLRGVDPIILDPYAFRLMDERQPGFSRDLVRRVEAHEFQTIVLGHGIEEPGPTDWYRVLLGPTLRQAIRENYHFKGLIEDHHVFEPNAARPGD